MVLLGSGSLTFTCPRVQVSYVLRNDKLRPGGRSCHPTRGVSPKTPSGGTMADTHCVGVQGIAHTSLKSPTRERTGAAGSSGCEATAWRRSAA